MSRSSSVTQTSSPYSPCSASDGALWRGETNAAFPLPPLPPWVSAAQLVTISGIWLLFTGIVYWLGRAVYNALKLGDVISLSMTSWQQAANLLHRPFEMLSNG